MIFWKIDDETIRCLINKDEISNLGYDLKTISEDADQMEAFLETIVQSSRDYIDWHTENGIQNYMARALPADQYLITISCTFQDEIIDRNLDQIRRMTEAFRARISEKRLEEIEALSGEEKEKAFAELSRDLYEVCSGDVSDKDREDKDQTDRDQPVATKTPETAGGSRQESRRLPDRKLVFQNLDDLIGFAGMLQKHTLYTSSLYKSADQYILLVQFDKCRKDSDAVSFILAAEEYGGECSPVHYDRAYMLEHGTRLLEDNALEILASI
ncbi:MAG: adaptor protein MecA [Eubacterium sp.]|nr:adaptor protein MecA [Eubacterium sp.]